MRRNSLPRMLFYLKVALLLVAIRAGLWLLPFGTVTRALASMSRRPTRRDESPSDPAVEEIVQAVASTGRVIPKANCLTQALAAQMMLNRRGCRNELNIGITRGEAGKMSGHAWLTKDGVVIFNLFNMPLEKYIRVMQ